MSSPIKIIIMIFLFVYLGYSQEEENNLKIFGYFQNEFYQETHDDLRNNNAFSMQQLNILLQKDMLDDWTAFINLQATNNFSSQRQWGTFSVEEAWIRYRYDNRFNLKLGLQIPVFNRLNEIKNRSPLLPYIVIPLVYEDSFSEDLDIESYIPKRAFVQAYGFWEFLENLKLDYAAYLGNSPNVSTWQNLSNSGQDTTDTILSGGRLGIRYKGLKAGISYTSDQVLNYAYQFSSLIRTAEDSARYGYLVEAQKPFRTKPVHRTRIGLDLSYEIGDWLFESEYIDVLHDNKSIFNLNKRFYYATLGYQFNEELFGYVSYWFVKEKYYPAIIQSFKVFTGGAAYSISDIVTLKIQMARIKFDYEELINKFNTNADFNYYSAAVSVYF